MTKYHVFEAEDFELNLVFTESELIDFREMWKADISLENMAKRMKRQPSELALLVFDHAERGIIQHRQKGIYGL